MLRDKLREHLLPTVAIVLAYFLLARVSLAAGGLFDGQISLVWLPTGLCYAWLWARGLRAWPPLLLGSLLVGWSMGSSPGLALWFAAVVVLEGVAAVAILRWLRFDTQFGHLRHVASFVVVGVLLVPALSAGLGSLGFVLFAGQPWEQWSVSAGTWWVGDALGALIFAPACFTWGQGLAWRGRSLLELLAILTGMCLVGVVVFGPERPPPFPAKYLLIPLVALLAMRFLHLGACLGAGLILALVVYSWLANPAMVLEDAQWLHSVLPNVLGFAAVNAILGLMIATVISQRDRNERRLRESESEQRARAEELQTMLDAVPAAVVLTPSPHMQDLIGNRKARELMRIPEGMSMFVEERWWEASGRHFERHGQTVAMTSMPLQRALGGETINNDQIVACYEDGSRRHLLVNAVPLLDGAGAVRGALAVLADVSELTQAQQQLKLADEALEHSGEALMIIDRDNRVMRVNRAFGRITGFSEAEVLGRDAGQVAGVPLDAEKRAQIRQALNDKGVWEGELNNRRANGQIYPAWYTISCVGNGDGEASHFISLFSDITERKHAESRMKHLAEHDFLTGLPNRVLFNDRVGQAIAVAQRAGSRFALMFLDLDRFKNINDTLGHNVGDQLLVQLAGRLRSCLRAGDTICRQGGDEFVVLLPGADSDKAARHLAQKLLDVIDRPFLLEGHELSVSASIGVVLYPHDGQDLDTLMKHADVAMYHAKSSGRHNFQFFTADLNARTAEALRLEFGLKRALERRELVLHFQPQVQVSDLRMVGFEALLRWPVEGSFVSPADFIPVAEDSGLIVPIGEWVLEESCRQLSLMPAGHELTIAVNVSALQFRQKDFVEMVGRVLSAYGVAPSRLELEVTESVVMHDVEDVIEKMKQLKALGVGIAIDDFGKGYSSLTYLKRFPITKLKIDQAFIRDCTHDPEDASIVQAIISLANSLGLEMIAEGVETPEQLEFLRRNRCEMAQGYLLGRPMPADQLRAIVEVSPVPSSRLQRAPGGRR